MSSQRKLISVDEQKMILKYLEGTRSFLRNKVIFLLSLNGLRVSEISALDWENIAYDEEGHITAIVERSRVSSGENFKRTIFLSKSLEECLVELEASTNIHSGPVIRSERGDVRMSAQSIANWFKRIYKDVGLVGLSGHSGRRTFITQAAIEIARAGGSLCDIQAHVGHISLQTTKHYLQHDDEARKRVVDMVDKLQVADKKEE